MIDLSQFTGTETWWRHPFGKGCTYTDGVKHFAENAGGGAYWFLDIVFTELVALMRKHEFLSITVTTVAETHRATITATDGNETTLWSKPIEFTTLEEGTYKFFFTGDVMLLPSEY